MKCPHCQTSIHEAWSNKVLEERAEGRWIARHMVCPSCSGFIVAIRRTVDGQIAESRIVWPLNAGRPVATEVSERCANDFKEAAAILTTSPKASAALSRRLLQDILRDEGGFTGPNLDNEIQQAIDSGTVPSWLAENLDAVRVVGNFAAHPIKSTNSGEVVDVESDEAAFLLDVLEGMFDFYFVQPEKAKGQRAAINAKLQAAGKPPLK